MYMTYDAAIQTVNASNTSTIADEYESDDTAPARGIFIGIAGSLVFWAACFAVWAACFAVWHFVF
jgi:hypothetical protein